MDETLPPIFDALEPPDRQTALSRFTSVTLEPGALMLEEGHEDPRLWVVCEGALEVHSRQITLSQIGAGELVGEMALFAGGIRSASVTATALSRLLALDWSSYDALRREQHPIVPIIEGKALEQLSDRLRSMGDRIAAQSEGSASEHALPSPGFFDRLASLFGGGGLTRVPKLDRALALARSPLFAGTPADVLAEVAEHFEAWGARRGHVVCAEGALQSQMYVIASGRVDVLVSVDTEPGQDERVEVLATLEPGEAFGMASLVQPQQPRMASCVVRETLEALVLDRSVWVGLSQRVDPVGSALRVALIRGLSDQLSYANHQLAEIGRQGEVQHRIERMIERARAEPPPPDPDQAPKVRGPW